MTAAPEPLPSDPDELRALLLAERVRHAAELTAARSSAEEEIARLRQIIRELQRHRFGRRVERLDPDQLALALEDLEQTLAAKEAEPTGSAATKPAPLAPRRRVNHGNLPADLPREEILIDVADKTCPCCGGALHPIDEDVSQRLDLVPARFGVLVTRRPKYACRQCEEGVVQAPAPVLDPGRGSTKTGQLWAYTRDDCPWNGPEPPAVAYVYVPDRKAERPVTYLEGFTGVLQVDGYAGYRKLAEGGAVRLAFCWAHVRRVFYDLQTGGSAPIVSEALRRIAQLYAVEAEIRGPDAEARRRERQARSTPLIADLKAWLEKQLATVSRKSTLAEAIRYALSRWEGLTLFLDDGRVEIDSNSVERSIRPLAIARPLCPCRAGC